MTDDLPPLFEPEYGHKPTNWTYDWTDDDMRAYARLALSPEWLAKRGLRLCEAEPAAWYCECHGIMGKRGYCDKDWPLYAAKGDNSADR